MFLCRTLLFFVVTLLCAGLAAPVQAQERYDDSKPREKFQIRVGGYYQRDIKTTLRIDSTSVNLGSFLELEDNLDVDSELSVLRVDGFYRFNPRHRIDWTWYVSNREGLTTLEEDLEIGDQIFPAGASVESELKSSLLKIGYSWSFINVRKYEFYLGGGLNFNDFSFRFVGQTGTEIFVEDEGVVFPLPTVNFGGRYNFTEKTQLSARWELFDLAYGDYEGRLQEVTLTLEHNTFNHIGFGGALSSFLTQLEIDDDDWRGELERSHNGVQLFMKFYY
ncbi:MAG: hypothetical protein O7F16_08755 [Acidobacteria bacterium]|nr:hypothetical protein [Acidobacteriota bacterium]